MNKKLAALRSKNDVTHALQLKLLERMNKTQIRKNSKNQSEIAGCEQKTTSEKANFSHKDPYTWNMINFRKLENKFYQKINKN